MKKFRSVFLAITLLIFSAQSAFAGQGIHQIHTKYMKDGSSLTTIIETAACTGLPESSASLALSDLSYAAGAQSPSPDRPGAKAKRVKTSKKIIFRSPAGKKLWYVKITGVFAYNGRAAICLKSRVSAKSNVHFWKVSDKKAWKSKRKVWKDGRLIWKRGNRAYASATAEHYRGKRLVESMPKIVSLTCSPAGKIR